MKRDPTKAKGDPAARGAEEAAGPGEGIEASGVAAAEAKANENWDLFLRAKAELENYRRRTERDIGLMVRRGKRDLLAKLLDVADALERAAAWEGGPDATPSGGPDAARAEGATVLAGVAHIQRQLLKVLSDFGVEPIESLGRPFDPSVHEAVDVQRDATVAAGTVTAEYQKGFTHEGELLRPARVRVSQPPD